MKKIGKKLRKQTKQAKTTKSKAKHKKKIIYLKVQKA